MAAKIKIYKIKDFIRLTETGEIDFDRSRELIREIASAADFHTDHNILIDLTETVVPTASISDLLQLAMDMARHKSLFQNKIANVVPDDDKRLAIAENFKACLDIQGFEYNFFTDFESAIEWLSETSMGFRATRFLRHQKSTSSRDGV